MRGVNKVILLGNLGRDPEVRYLPSGGAVANITLATSESWRDKTSGQPQEQTEWHRVVFYGKLAEVAGQFLHKGSKVYVEGALHTRKWQDKASGQDRYTTEIKGFSMEMVDSRNDQKGEASNDSHFPAYEEIAQEGAPRRGMSRQAAKGPAAQAFDFDDDIPF